MPDSLAPYDFDLPDGLIAQRPAERRDASRMLVLHRGTGAVEDRQFADLGEFLDPGDALVFNDTRVVPARLVGRRPTGGRAELFLVERAEDGTWSALAKPGRKLTAGAEVLFDEHLGARVEAVEESGRRRVRLLRDGHPFETVEAEEVAIEQIGRMPLPPYVDREADAADRERYQTVFARKRGAIAAPTAGLHFTPGTVEALREQGVVTAEVTLHVGYGTFEPVRADDLREHRVAPERIEVSPATADALNGVRQSGGRVVAVGTTSTRALETSADDAGRFHPVAGPTDLTVTPGYRFRAVDALLTNFHLPKSSLLVLTATFGGLGPVMEAYRHAVREGYRFYSYGDCMLIV
ncbi:tRNA preQ1(34) S-adenosylmethionine ribosyltransferase-isomerase QueA [Rubrivirga marina]|uniref:S-adenosylmethionine:tRNA ribosyltransferase-isomerase n=1 Tax=Rubrivirga marina TaxID=1196024 RepID=A0A271J394_9BACT|nr:tRNA preQ1(34) S-adenosylmethionine ribosyltransferase-isomerase QueA [Rubrivirga marina]PAP77972.1 tRNA preQ1(34) S-adenosylmethionine ribosyltransferase-isomerase QueA [Rubrivirga marina]